MSFIDKYYAIFNNSVGQHSVTINRAEFANLLGVFSKQEEELNQLKAENEELKKSNIHIENNRMVKAEKLKRIEDLIIACNSGCTDEFIQELLVILHEPEPSSFKNKYKQTLAEIIRFFKEDDKFARYSGYPIIFTSSALEKIEKILKENDIKISEVENEHNGLL